MRLELETGSRKQGTGNWKLGTGSWKLATYDYDERILDELARHGLKPRPSTSPQQLRDAVRDLYKYEIRRLRSELLARRFPRQDYAGHVIELRKRYRLLSVPIELWTVKN